MILAISIALRATAQGLLRKTWSVPYFYVHFDAHDLLVRLREKLPEGTRRGAGVGRTGGGAEGIHISGRLRRIPRHQGRWPRRSSRPRHRRRPLLGTACRHRTEAAESFHIAPWTFVGLRGKERPRRRAHRLTYRDSLRTGGDAGHGSDGRKAAIPFHMEAAHCAISFTDIEELAICGHAKIKWSADQTGRPIKQGQRPVRCDFEATNRCTTGVRGVGVAAIRGRDQPAWRRLTERNRAAHQFQLAVVLDVIRRRRSRACFRNDRVTALRDGETEGGDTTGGIRGRFPTCIPGNSPDKCQWFSSPSR